MVSEDQHSYSQKCCLKADHCPLLLKHYQNCSEWTDCSLTNLVHQLTPHTSITELIQGHQSINNQPITSQRHVLTLDIFKYGYKTWDGKPGENLER